MSVAMQNEKVVAATVFELLQNTPNPFESYTNISFRLPVASAATLTIYDVDQSAQSSKYSGQKGLNTVTLSKSELNGNRHVLLSVGR
ncbi:MAG: hypothetical protein U0T81_14590 [Saprospiraceae bacterium]